MNPSNLTLNRSRSGFTSTELIVASSLMVAIMGIVGPLAVRTARLWKDSRHQQLALEELTAEIERLSALDSTARSAAMQSLSPSEALRQAAPHAEIKAESLRDDEGARIVLTLHWNEPGPPRPPMRLVGWLDPLPPEESP